MRNDWFDDDNDDSSVSYSWLPLVWPFLILLLLFDTGHAQEVDRFVSACGSQAACTLETAVPWTVGAKTWRFTAMNPNESIRIWIHNNSSSTASGQTISIFITDDQSATSLLTQADRWVQAAVIDNTIAGAQCNTGTIAAKNSTGAPGANGKATCYSVGMYAVQVAIRITGAVTTGGTPDNFDIGIVQQPSTYPGGPNPGNDSSAGEGTNISGFNNINSGLIPQLTRGGDSSAGSGPARSSELALPVQSVFQRAANAQINSVNPWVIGCVFGVSATVAASRNQYVNCDTNGILRLQGFAGAGAATSGFFPFVSGYQDTAGNAQFLTYSDPCMDPNVTKSHAFANITTATTTALVPVSGSTNIYVCDLDFDLVSTTTDTILFESGTGVACAVVTGCISSGICTATYRNSTTVQQPYHLGSGHMLFATGASNGFCAVTTVGTSPNIAVDVTFVQR